MKTIGEKISIARGNENLTQSELAEILNIAPQKVIDWEKNLDIPNAAMIKAFIGDIKCSCGLFL